MGGVGGQATGIAHDVLRHLHAPPERVLDVVGEEAVDRVSLMAGELRQAAGGAVGARQAEDALEHAEQAAVERDAVVNHALAVAAHDPATGRREVAWLPPGQHG